MKSFLRAIQYLSKYIEKLSAQTDFLGQLLRKQLELDNRTLRSIQPIKAHNHENTVFAHSGSVRPNTITTDASTKGVGATLWQKEDNGD